MAKLLQGRGYLRPESIRDMIEKRCRELSIDWGVSPAAVEAGIRSYLEGAAEILPKDD